MAVWFVQEAMANTDILAACIGENLYGNYDDIK